MNPVTLNIESVHTDSASSDETSGFADLLRGQVPIESVLNEPELLAESVQAAAPSSSKSPAAEATTRSQGRHRLLVRGQR